MNIQRLANLIAKREGGKHQASVGDIREILKIIVEMEVEHLLDPDSEIGEGPIDALVNRAVMMEERKGKKK